MLWIIPIFCQHCAGQRERETNERKKWNQILTAIDVGQVPGGTLATVVAEIAEAVLGENRMGGDASIGADKAAVAGTSLAVCAVRVAARATPSADALIERQRRQREVLIMKAGLTRAWSSTLKLAL